MTRRIVRELPDEPQLEGRRITVQFVKTQVEDRGLEPRTVAGRHDIDVTDVYRALTYYHDPRRRRAWTLSRGGPARFSPTMCFGTPNGYGARVNGEWQVPGRRDTQSF